MSWYRREVIFSGIMALTLITVQSAMSYLLPPQTGTHEVQYIYQTPEPYEFAFTEGSVSNKNQTLDNQTLDYEIIDLLQLEFIFTFIGKYPIHEPNMEVGRGETAVIRPDYYGEFNATSLQSIDIELFRFYYDGSHIENVTSWGLYKNVTIKAFLRTTQTIDLGVRTSTNEGFKTTYSYIRGILGMNVHLSGWDNSATGFWQKNHGGGWFIDVDQLSSMLQGNGTAHITFDTTISTQIKYETKNETEETNEMTLPTWQGRLGTIEIEYQQGKITWIRYSFSRASLILFSTPWKTDDQ